MKKLILSWCVLGLGVLLSQSLAFADQMYGVFMVTKGSVKIQSAKAGATDAKVGAKVFEGDTVITAADSRAKIVMSDRNVINVSPDTKIQISKYQNDAASGKKNVELNLLQGKVRNNVEQTYDGEKSKFLIKTPTAVAGVRGTQFMAGYNPATQMTSIVTFKGAVTFSSVNLQGKIVGSPVLVKKGESTSAAPNAPPEPPKAMPKEEMKKVDAETTAAAKEGSGSRNVASDGSTPPMVDKVDMDPNMAKKIDPPLGGPAPIPPPVINQNQTKDTTSVVKDILRDSLGKTKVIVRPQPSGN